MLCFHFLLFICWSSWEPKLIRLEDFKRTSQPIIKYLITLFYLIYLLIFVYFSLFSPIDCFSLINLLVVHLCYLCYKTTKHYINQWWLYFDLLFASQWKYLKHTLIGRYMMCWSLHCSSGESVQAWSRVTVVNNIFLNHFWRLLCFCLYYFSSSSTFWMSSSSITSAPPSFLHRHKASCVSGDICIVILNCLFPPSNWFPIVAVMTAAAACCLTFSLPLQLISCQSARAQCFHFCTYVIIFIVSFLIQIFVYCHCV